MKSMHAALACALAVLFAAATPRPAAADPPPFQLEPGDRISIIGNTLAERMQHDGWLETLLHARFPEHELVIRNLGFSGDTIGTRLRSENFGTPDEWLRGQAEPIGGYDENRFEPTKTQADVIFAFFGYNESYAGEDGLDEFRDELGGWIEHTLSQRYNGETAPRLVLFSPIAHEDLNDPDLPDGEANNRRLRLYTRAMAEVAAEHGVAFVDLFGPSADLYEAADDPLTINGVHLNSGGNRRIAEVIDRSLFGEGPARDSSDLDSIREAVRDKNFHWFRRHRVTDGYSTFGTRAFLVFHRSAARDINPDDVDEDGLLPNNYEVLQRELRVLDVMTANRDERIWAVARGKNHTVDDSNAPPFVDAKTNKPGPGPDGEHEFLYGEENLEKLDVADGFEVTLFASEQEFPELANPVQMNFDAHGRLWVACWPNYPHWQPGTPMGDKLLILEDTTGDGRADRLTVFADDLHNPTGFAFHDGGVILAQQPDLWFLNDTTGDGRADHRERIVHGFDSADTHHAINSFVFDPGGGLYMAEGIFHRTQIETPWAPTLRVRDGGVYRFEPRTWKMEMFSPISFPNPHGHVFDRWGRNIVTDGTGGSPYYGPSMSTRKEYPAREPGNAPRVFDPNRALGGGRVRPTAATEIISSRHFPQQMQGNLIVANVIGFRGLYHWELSEDGAGLKAENPRPLLSSADENFRPVDVEIAPDGSLYFIDWHNPLIGHMQHNLRDNSRDNTHGRVYRVTHTERPLLDPAPIAGEPIGALLDRLKEPEDRVRYRARAELGARDTDEVLWALGRWSLDPSDPDHEHHMTEVLWLHQRHNVVNERLLKRQLRSDDPRARAAATRVLCHWRNRIEDPLALLQVQANDKHPAVRLEAVRACSFFRGEDAIRAAEIALESLNHEQDRFLEHALDQTMNVLEPFLQ